MSLQPLQWEFFIPPLQPGDARVSALLRVLEGFFPGVDVSWELVGPRKPTPDERQYRQVRVENRDAWLAEKLNRSEAFQLYSAPGQVPLNVSADPFMRSPAEDLRESGRIMVWFSQDELFADPRLARLVLACGDVMRAWHMAYMPLAARSVLMPVLFHSKPTARGAPGLVEKFPGLAALPRLGKNLEALPGPESPLVLGWLNYWSADTARLLGFPDDARDGEWLARSTRSDSGAWAVKLTDAPFDLNRPEHVDTLVRAYRRFEHVGVR